MNKILEQKLKDLPRLPGVYIYRDTKGTVIYVGKAVNIKNRVSSYFKNTRLDPKTRALVEKIDDLETIECESEIEALILESELIKRYKPKYNIEWKDDKNYCYIRITREDYPRVEVVRQIVDDRATYFGPFVDSQSVRVTLKTLRRVFPFCTCGLPGDRVCLYYHLKLCPGHGPKYISPKDYQKIINNLIQFLQGKRGYIQKSLEREMKAYVKKQEYEKAADIRDRLFALSRVRYRHIIKETRDLSLDKALQGLAVSLNLIEIPERIECYDISNISGTSSVGSMVVFERGLSKKGDYRRFKVKTVSGSNDFAMLQEVLKRRFSKINGGKDTSFRQVPDLIVIDGGKGQLSASQEILIEIGVKLPIVGLAKKFEEVYSLNEEGKFKKTTYPDNSEVRYLLQRIRDEAHRFAITYHRSLRSKKMTASSLEDIEGIGPKTRKKLISSFGSISKIKEADEPEIAKVVGSKLAEKIKKTL
jgi:excinuclease ABC subunit C